MNEYEWNRTRVYQVGELTSEIRRVLTDEFVELIWVRGEVSNLTHHSSGHTYFSLKDERAVIKCVIFRNLSFRSVGLEEGMEIVTLGKIDIFPKGSTYQLIVHDWQTLGLGFYSQLFEEIKERLKNKGYFDEERKREIPFYASRIGIATSPTGAAIKDILRVIWTRNPNTRVVLAPCNVQGEGSAESISSAIELLNEYGELDVIIVGRGGGSVEDLWSFNDEIVAEAIYNSRIPVISAVGHEVDFTIADFVADLRAPTPSIAGEMVSKNLYDLKSDLSNSLRTLHFLMNQRISSGMDEIYHLLKHRNLTRTEYIINEGWQMLDIQEGELHRFITDHSRDKLHSLSEYQNKLSENISTYIDEKERECELLRSKMEILDYKKTLGRGFSILFDGERNVISSVREVQKDEDIYARLKDGELKTRVEEVSYEEN